MRHKQVINFILTQQTLNRRWYAELYSHQGQWQQPLPGWPFKGVLTIHNYADSVLKNIQSCFSCSPVQFWTAPCVIHRYAGVCYAICHINYKLTFPYIKALTAPSATHIWPKHGLCFSLLTVLQFIFPFCAFITPLFYPPAAHFCNPVPRRLCNRFPNSVTPDALPSSKYSNSN